MLLYKFQQNIFNTNTEIMEKYTSNIMLSVKYSYQHWS